MSNEPQRITIARGDGIGPSIMDATLQILEAAGARLKYDEVQIGEKVYLSGNKTGMSDGAWDLIRRNKVFLKAPITTPQGGGYRSLNVATRKAFGLYANVRPCVSYDPFVQTKHPGMDVVIIRENEEDLYAGIEYQQTQDVVQCLKLITRPGCERIVRYAFEYARKNGRKKVTCFTKDNIMKQSDGLFRSVFNEIGAEYPDIDQDHWIIDIGSAMLADRPETFDVIVTLNLYGDIISDIAAQIAGSVGLAGSANIGQDVAMFEAIHGSAPMIAGQGIANPSGLLLGAVMMLVHLGQNDIAERIHNAWLKTLEDGTHTPDIYKEGASRHKVGTDEFTTAVIQNIGQSPSTLPSVAYTTNSPAETSTAYTYKRPSLEKQLVGIDLFIEWTGTPAEIADQIQSCDLGPFTLERLSNRGIDVWPDTQSETFCVDLFRCRFLSNKKISPQDCLTLQSAIFATPCDIVKTEHLYTLDAKNAFSA